MRLGIAIARAASLTNTWTTVQLATVALKRGHSVRFIEPWDFEVDARGEVLARAHAFDPPAPLNDHLVEALHKRTARRCFVTLGRLDLLLLRCAPISPALLTFAALAQERGVAVVNDPRGAQLVSDKAWLAAQPDVRTPATLVTRSLGAAHMFYQQHGTVIVKPARGSGGRAVSLVRARRPTDLDAAWATATRRGEGFVVLQDYVTEADQGEKRIVWLDGEVLGGYLRRRAPGEFRHNLKQGGTIEAMNVTDEERETIRTLTPHLLRAGIRFAGLDLIGSQIIEVNALNPGGTYHTDRLTGSRLAERVIEHFETKRTA